LPLHLRLANTHKAKKYKRDSSDGLHGHLLDSIFNANVIGFGYTQPSIRGRLLEMIDDQQFDRALLLHQPQAKLVR
jgi:hypothetical protein